MNLFQVVTYRPLARCLPLGPVRTPPCEGRACGNRTAPVFVALGVKGALLLCEECRAWKDRIIRERLPEIRRTR